MLTPSHDDDGQGSYARHFAGICFSDVLSQPAMMLRMLVNDVQSPIPEPNSSGVENTISQDWGDRWRMARTALSNLRSATYVFDKIRRLCPEFTELTVRLRHVVGKLKRAMKPPPKSPQNYLEIIRRISGYSKELAEITELADIFANKQKESEVESLFTLPEFHKMNSKAISLRVLQKYQREDKEDFPKARGKKGRAKLFPVDEIIEYLEQKRGIDGLRRPYRASKLFN